MSRLESSLEKFTKDFVHYKIEEEVYLRLGDSIELHSTRNGGSSFLASFWANVLQHRSNYPPSQYRYQTKLINGEDHLVLNTREVTFKVNMSNGCLSMNGDYIYKWFTNKFKVCLDNFDRNFSRSWVFQPTPAGKLLVAPEYSTELELFPKTETEEYILLENRGERSDSFQEKIDRYSIYLIKGIGDFSLSKPVWTYDEVQEQLISLRGGGVYSGPDYVYPLWRSFLNYCFSRKGTRVYLSSPQLDAERLQELIEIYTQNKLTADLHSFYVSFKCDPVLNIGAVQKKALCAYSPQQQAFIEYSILRKMIYPVSKLLASFVAAENSDGNVEVLLLGANFHGCHMTNDTVSTVAYVTLSVTEFKKRYVCPLEIPAVSTLSL